MWYIVAAMVVGYIIVSSNVIQEKLTTPLVIVEPMPTTPPIPGVTPSYMAYGKVAYDSPMHQWYWNDMTQEWVKVSIATAD